MKIESSGTGFIITRGKEDESVFCFFVDGDGSSWSTKRTWNARHYKTEQEAQEDIDELKRRARIRRHPSNSL